MILVIDTTTTTTTIIFCFIIPLLDTFSPPLDGVFRNVVTLLNIVVTFSQPSFNVSKICFEYTVSFDIIIIINVFSCSSYLNIFVKL